MRSYQAFLLFSFLVLPIFSLQADEVDESFFVESDVVTVRNVIHGMRKRDFLRIPLFFLAPSLVKSNVFNGTVLYDRLSGGETANIDVTAEEDGESRLVKVQVIGNYSGEFAVIGHNLVSNIERNIRVRLP